MVSPTHACAWLAKFRIHVKIDGLSLASSGSCAEAALSALCEGDVVLFAREEEIEFDGWVNAGIVVMDRGAVADLTWEECPELRAVTIRQRERTIGVLTPEIDTELRARGPLAELAIHDDCFVAATASSETVLQQVLLGLLRLNEHHVGHEVDWAPHLSRILSVARAEGGVNIRSYPQEDVVRLESPRRRFLFLRRVIACFDVSSSKTGLPG
jgi:hypothetical protein